MIRVPHGVPQGSILGPVIFNLYVSDIWKIYDDMIPLKLSQYADDLCILTRSAKPFEASRRAGRAAGTVINYYKRWGLKCNIDKTECILFTAKRQHRPRFIRVEDELLEYKKTVKYLGVHFDQRMTMQVHTDKVIEKAKRVRGGLSSIIGYHSRIDAYIKLAVIQACLLPILDYGVVQLLPRYTARRTC